MMNDYENMDMCDYAFEFIGSPYHWGGNAVNMDCSGLVLESLKAIHNFPNIDITANDLFEYLKPRKNCLQIFHEFQRNDILFFGSLEHKIHVALALGKTKMIESGGGGSRTLTIEDAIKQGAMVRFRNINKRKDLISGIRILETEDWSY